ncbi:MULTISPECIES: hypothetical protein [unclassified Streptomyces]|uniref:hypothetical protein n=1 Tax=unclassified Streptomyces TaxID=2593676 RepID=UPI001161F9EB|nr:MULTISPECIES: hypothetical protein [unclassified Streptomyces]NMI55759.1 hypothetical protein [Streptomyces sp. RLA2-12]QDN55245.1 hypothetical protein FNV67_07710 [Streptomyces sp. S1D4-20]QDN65424.1 hypothetical protein FNV66_07310 [Streptomyces sp. S1D4-14]QDN96064.1 hypothetical protein FNV58_08425 [Streptomyces sp. RLB1-9]QDO17768.1 hypothetical protein FNV65_06870 [Streptomyces sp. S1A1-8]
MNSHAKPISYISGRNTHRRSASGQQAVAMRPHKWITEDAIREIEAERDELLVQLSPHSSVGLRDGSPSTP